MRRPLAHGHRASRDAAFGIGCASIALSCWQQRYEGATPPAYDTDVAPVLQSHCVSCHSGPSPPAGWRATSFLETIACVSPSGVPAVAPANARAPILATLGVAPHAGLLSATEREVLERWVIGGAPAFRGTVHPPGIVDPASDAWHGTVLRADHWAPMLDPNDPNACGRCHDGDPARPAGVLFPAPGAPSCTSCHDGADGVLACSTCHGSGPRAYPPRDPCFFPADSVRSGAHAAHVESSAARAGGLPCATCHPTPGPGVIGGVHGNGKVDIVFDPVQVPGDASYDSSTGACAVSCHDLGGDRPRPSWTDTAPLGCTGCHGAPPASHPPGACNGCHEEANASGTALNGGPLHLNGRVDLGDGSGQCGACHGSGDDPWPRTGVHRPHETPSLTVPMACASCHVVPETINDPTHLDGVVHVTFSGLALARGAAAAWDGERCATVACHGAKLVNQPAIVPAWSDTSGAASACGACHGIPPGQHTPSTLCGRATCHGSEASVDARGNPRIASAGLARHINGVIDLGP